MRELWCDFDGVIVPNGLTDINIAGITSETFVDLVTNAYLKNPVTSKTIKAIISGYRKTDSKVNIITGRKKSYLSDLTEMILEEHNIEVDKIYYYPEENPYVVSEYYGWKTEVINESINSGNCREIRVIDDDKELLRHLRERISYDLLNLTHYEFFKDGSEEIEELYQG